MSQLNEMAPPLRRPNSLRAQRQGTAESAVQVVTRWILARLRHTVLADVHAADAAISALLASLNQRLDGRQPVRRAGRTG